MLTSLHCARGSFLRKEPLNGINYVETGTENAVDGSREEVDMAWRSVGGLLFRQLGNPFNREIVAVG
jgi:hypothetical protein